MKKILGAFVLSILITGCTLKNDGHFGHESSTQVHLSQNNFDVIKSVSGSAAAEYFFHIGTSDENLYEQAKKNMIENAGLNGAQALINITTDEIITGFLIWQKKEVSVSAEVVQFR